MNQQIQIDPVTLGNIAKIADIPVELLRKAFDFINSCHQDDEIISYSDLKERFGWSHSTLKRRLFTAKITPVTQKGWKTKRGIRVLELKKLGLGLRKGELYVL